MAPQKDENQPGWQAELLLAERYRLVQPVGFTEGEAWLAADLASREASCLVIRQTLQQEAFAQQQARRERTAGLSHPGILPLLDLQQNNQQSGDSGFAVFAWQPGLAPLSLKSGDALARLLSAGQSLIFIHQLQLAHGNLTRDSLLTAEGQTLLGGFGLLPPPSSPFLSPRLAGEPLADPLARDDVFSFASLVYLSLTGEIWQPEAWHQDFRPAAKQLPESLQISLAEALNPDQLARPGDLQLLLRELQQYLDPEPLAIKPARREPAAAEKPKAAAAVPLLPQKSPVPGLLVSGLTLLLALTGLFFILQPGGGGTPAAESAALLPAEAKREAEDAGAAAQELSPVEKARLSHQQQEAEKKANELVRAQIEFEEQRGYVWAAGAQKKSEEVSAEGDQLFRKGEFAAAGDAYTRAAMLLREAVLAADSILAVKLTQGKTRLAEGDAEAAAREFELALAVEPENQEAAAGLGRAKQLPKVMALVARAAEYEKAGSLAEAKEIYQAASSLDPDWPAAGEGLKRTGEALSLEIFRRQMSLGFSALQEGSLAEARKNFLAARETRPGSSESADGLHQVQLAERLKKLEALRKKAEAASQSEKWQQAEELFRQMQQVDESLIFARNHRLEAAQRHQLDQQLEQILTDPLVLVSDERLADAGKLLLQATRIENPGPRIKGQILRLATVLEQARLPVAVQLTSDGKTRVSLFPLGELGEFTEKTLELVPGHYTLAGSRRGYRDVRFRFDIKPGDQAKVLHLVCTESI